MTVELRSVSHVHSAGSPWARSALESIDLRFEDGERALIVGSNGSGKTTLAWILAGLTAPTHGTAIRNGEPLVDQAADIGFLLQHARLQLLRPTVAAEIGAWGSTPDRIRSALEDMGFPLSVLDRSIDQLSVGQQRRIGLAVLLARGTRLIVLDEPMAGLDRGGRDALADAIDRLPDTTTVLSVTHDLSDSRRLGQRIIHLDQGRILDDRPAQSETA